MTHAQVLAACLIVPLCLSACSKKSNVYVPDEKDQLSDRITSKIQPQDAIVPADQLQPFDRPLDDEITIINFQEFIVPDGKYQEGMAKLRQDLKLKPNQMLLIGNFEKSFGPQLDLTNTSLPLNANDLAINHARRLKTTTELPTKDEYESTADYQKRVQAYIAKNNEITSRIKVDLGRIEGAINFLSLPTEINDKEEVKRSHYDADRQVIQFNVFKTFTVQETRKDDPNQVEFVNYSNQIQFEIPATPDKARELLEPLQQFSPSYYIAYVIDENNKSYSLSKIVILQYVGGFNDLKVVTEFHPKEIIIQHKNGEGQLLDTQNIKLGQPLKYSFGMGVYRQPKMQQPESVESTPTSAAVGSTPASTAQELEGE